MLSNANHGKWEGVFGVLLWKYAENYSANHELQVLSVVPLKSGYIEENGVIRLESVLSRIS